MYKLTIAHGTYENLEKFKKTFLSIIPQLKIHKNVQLLILDDSISNQTKDFVSEFKLKNVKYVKGTKKSIDHAFIWLMANAEAEYVWWFGDDVVKKGTISYLLNIIEKNNPDFVFINSIGEKKSLNYGKNLKMTGPEVIEKIGDLMLFLSSLLWKKKIIYPFLYKHKQKFGIAIGFAYPQMEAIVRGGKFFYIDRPLFYTEIDRDFDKLFYDPFKVFELLNTFINYKNFENVIKLEKRRRGFQIFKGVLYYKYKRNHFGLGKTTFKEFFTTYRKWSIYWLSFPLIVFLFVRSYFVKAKKLNPKLEVDAFLNETFKCIKCHSYDLTLDKRIIKCNSCNYSLEKNNNIILVNKKDNDFYEDKYLGKINYTPKTQSIISNFFLWVINNGYVWSVKQNCEIRGKLLEIGPGGGVNYFNNFYNIAGIDLSYKGLLSTGYQFGVKSKVDTNLPFKDNSFDCIAGSFVWEHINDKGKVKSLKEFYRILKVNGSLVLLFDIDTENTLWKKMKSKNFKLFKKLFIDNDMHIGFSSYEENLKIFKNSSFKIKKIVGNEKTFLQSWSTYGKISQFYPLYFKLYKFLDKYNSKVIYYIYTIFLRIIDRTLFRLMSNKNARTLLVILKK